MKQTPDRQVTTVTAPLPSFPPRPGTIAEETSPCPALIRIAYRAFDRQYLIPDARIIDRGRPELWQVASDWQVFAVEQHDEPLTAGPGLLFTADVPDMHYFKGRGGRVLPLFRDSACLAANIAPGLLKAIFKRLGVNATTQDFLAYTAGITAHSAYTRRFAAELRAPGIRVPLTADARLWSEAVSLGRQVLWLHTYGERCADPAQGRKRGEPKLPPERRPKVVATIPDTTEDMPESISYDQATRTLHVGSGQIRPVSPQAWAYETSGMKIVRKWFGYRKKDPAGRRSSPLDDINAYRWPARFTTELPDQLIGELPLTPLPGQAGRHRRHHIACHLTRTGSWTGAPDNLGAASAVSAVIRGICAASTLGARGRTSHSPPVVGSSPTRPTCGTCQQPVGRLHPGEATSGISA